MKIYNRCNPEEVFTFMLLYMHITLHSCYFPFILLYIHVTLHSCYFTFMLPCVVTDSFLITNQMH